jgi:hypothetical protein
MYCSTCGKEVAEGQAFCGNCGAPAPTADDQPTAPTQPVETVPPVAVAQPLAPPPAEPVAPTASVTPAAPPLSLDLPEPPRRRTGLIVLIVILLVLLIAVAFVVALLVTRDHGTPAATTVPGVTTTVAAGPGETSAPAGSGELVDVSLSTSSIAASSVLPDQGSVDYAPANLVDGWSDTCWAENAAGYGVGEYVEFTWPSPVTISQVRIVAGYDKTASGWDRWVSNGRVRTFDLVFSDGSTESLTVTDTKPPQTLTLGALHTVTWVQFVITGYYEAAGPHKAEDTSVSELHFWGTE